MKEHLPLIENWLANQQPFALARVTKTWGSSPRPVGSTMLVGEDGEIVGSVSGGCVEGAVVKAALPLIENGEGKKLAFGVSDDEAWNVGLSCGGNIKVFVQQFLVPGINDQLWKQLVAHLRENKNATLVTALKDGEQENTLITENGEIIGAPIDSAMQTTAAETLDKRTHALVEKDGTDYFIHPFPRKNQLFIVGAAHVTSGLIKLGKEFGFEVILIDPRDTFARKTHFDQLPDQIFIEYPSEVLERFVLGKHSYFAILSHDPKIDDNALQVILNKDVAYIGALGSRKTHAKRIARLQELGVSEKAIQQIRAPIGVDIHAKTAPEIALSIISEIISVKNKYV
jgi:xanthine dehydrogenase accessory factor